MALIIVAEQIPIPSIFQMTVYFYSKREEHYGCFLNFSRHGFELDGLYWPTSEHYFQAQKFSETPHSKEIRQAKTPNSQLAVKVVLLLYLRSRYLNSSRTLLANCRLLQYESSALLRSIRLTSSF